MSDLLILGTDTDAGKTTFALLCLAAFPDRFEYWKPVETGDSDTELIRRLVPGAHSHNPLARFGEAVAPLLAARHEGSRVPAVAEIEAPPEKLGDEVVPLPDKVAEFVIMVYVPAGRALPKSIRAPVGTVSVIETFPVTVAV